MVSQLSIFLMHLLQYADFSVGEHVKNEVINDCISLKILGHISPYLVSM